MLKPDLFFYQYRSDFPSVVNRLKARRLFRRAIREYYVMQRTYVIDPSSGARVASILQGEVIKRQKNQRRKIKIIFSGRAAPGRPRRPEIRLLVARLFVLWIRYASTKATFSWKISKAIPTNFECFLLDLMPRLGAPDVRRYVEEHWRSRK